VPGGAKPCLDDCEFDAEERRIGELWNAGPPLAESGRGRWGIGFGQVYLRQAEVEGGAPEPGLADGSDVGEAAEEGRKEIVVSNRRRTIRRG
jgi:hypothetical protein